MAVVARADTDRWARASYLEGMLGYSPGSLTNNIGQLDEGLRALQTGEPNRLTEALIYERGMSDNEAEAMLGKRDRKLFEALLAGVRKYIPDSIRGIEAEDVAQSIVMGLSPITLKPFPQYKGANMFHFLGTKAPSRVSLPGIVRVVRDHAGKKAMDVVRGTSTLDLGPSLSDSGAAGRGRGDADGAGDVLEDVLSGESAVSRADYIAMAESIFQNPAIMRKLDSAVRQFLGGPGQVAVWDVVKENPHLIQVKGSAQGEPVVGLASREAAELVAEITGTAVSPQAVGKTWRTKVWPAMRTAFRDSDVARALLRNRQIMEIIDEETRRRQEQHQKVRDIRRVGDPPAGNGPAGPAYDVSGDPNEFGGPPGGNSDFYEKEMARMRRKYKIPPGVKFATLDERAFQKYAEQQHASALRVAAAWAGSKGLPVTLTETREVRKQVNAAGETELIPGATETKLAWRMPPREAAMYRKLLAWAKRNFAQFSTPRGDLDTDKLAEELATRAGKSWWADDPTHWVYEIAYDVNRLAPSLG